MFRNLSFHLKYFVFFCIERTNAIFSCVGDSAFFETGQFNWISVIEAQVDMIQREFQSIKPETIPNIQDISPDQSVLTNDQNWKAFGLYFYGHKAEENCKQCPGTVDALQNVPGLKTAFFSILSPQKHIPPHRGSYNGILRYHLGLQVPVNDEQCGIRVGNEIQYWQEGKSLVFNEYYNHEAWNDTDFTRVVLIIDFERPLYWPLSKLNQWAIDYIGKTPFVSVAMKNLNKKSD